MASLIDRHTVTSSGLFLFKIVIELLLQSESMSSRTTAESESLRESKKFKITPPLLIPLLLHRPMPPPPPPLPPDVFNAGGQSGTSSPFSVNWLHSTLMNFCCRKIVCSRCSRRSEICFCFFTSRDSNKINWLVRVLICSFWFRFSLCCRSTWNQMEKRESINRGAWSNCCCCFCLSKTGNVNPQLPFFRHDNRATRSFVTDYPFHYYHHRSIAL